MHTSMKIEIPESVNIRVGKSAEFGGGALGNWEAFERWAQLNVSCWNMATRTANAHGMTELDRTRLLAWMMLRCYADARNQLLEAVVDGIYPPGIVSARATAARLPSNEGA